MTHCFGGIHISKVHIDWVIVALSSARIHAGLACKARSLDYSGRLLGISLDEPMEKLMVQVAQLASPVSLLENHPQNIQP